MQKNFLDPDFEWPSRENQDKGSYNIVNDPLIDVDKVILPEMHIRHGIGTQFIKKLVSKNLEAANYLKTKFKITDAKLIGGVLNGPKFRSLFKVAVFL